MEGDASDEWMFSSEADFPLSATHSGDEKPAG
jgi:hypothetical protein